MSRAKSFLLVRLALATASVDRVAGLQSFFKQCCAGGETHRRGDSSAFAGRITHCDA